MQAKLESTDKTDEKKRDSARAPDQIEELPSNIHFSNSAAVDIGKALDKKGSHISEKVEFEAAGATPNTEIIEELHRKSVNFDSRIDVHVV